MDVSTFIGNYLSSQSIDPEALGNPRFRELLYQQVHPAPPKDLLPLIRVLFDEEVTYRSAACDELEYYENLYWTALFLFQLGDLQDVLPMWRAKQINMDTAAGFDIQFLVGQGVVETLEFLLRQKTPEADEAARALLASHEAGDFEQLEEWLKGRIAYFNST